MIDAVLEKCSKAGFLDDQAYAETKTRSLRRRGGSQRKIEAQLTAKGVDRAIIESALRQDEQTDLSAAHIFARRRRLGPYRSADDRHERRDKDLAAMCRAGFSYEVARQVIDASNDDGRRTKASD
ncbi:regulatory protein RecX [Roseibium salinum]|uniref:regulatory protein RecX n=1 Tax=Roseibium salinum TaxID=1604349 RepID=UPI003606FEF6